jgi:raffinose/stachyose/melibiose transport system permease protein
MSKSTRSLAGLSSVAVESQKRLNRFLSSPSILNVLYLPALILFSVFIIYPFIQGVRLSFTNWNGYSPHFDSVGWRQYERLLTDKRVHKALSNTLVYGIGSTVLQNFFGLLYALFLNQKLRGKELVRVIVYLPVIVSPLIMGYIFYFFFRYDGGAINDILVFLGEKRVNWLGQSSRSVPIITLVNTYQYMGIAMVIFLAGLQSIPQEYYEAAVLDGASRTRCFRHVTLPLLMPAITVNIVINLIGGLKLFDVIMAMTKGGPGYASQSLSTMMYTLYFVRQDAGYAAALGNMMFLMITVLSISVLIFLRRKEVEL